MPSRRTPQVLSARYRIAPGVVDPRKTGTMCAVIASLPQNLHPRTTASRLVSLVIVMVTVTVVVMAMAMAGAVSGQNAPHPDWATERWKAHWIACPDAP